MGVLKLQIHLGILVAAEPIGATLDLDGGIVELPHGFARAFVEGEEMGLGVGAAVNVDEIAMNDR